jgi:hypothetical protein
VRSEEVVPFIVPPLLKMYWKWPALGTFSEPWNIMCSKRCAKPVRPAFSFFEPTWNHSLTCTTGSLRSTCRITCRPFGSV